MLLLKMVSCEILTPTAKYTKPMFDSSPVSVGFLVVKMALWRVILREDLLRFSPCHYYSTIAPHSDFVHASQKPYNVSNDSVAKKDSSDLHFFTFISERLGASLACGRRADHALGHARA
jgi:hypothetical protein